MKPAVEASEELTLKAIYSRSLKSAQSLSTNASHIDLYSNDSGPGKGFHDLLNRTDIQAVIIAQAPPLLYIIRYAYFMSDFPLPINPNTYVLRSRQESMSCLRSQ